MKLRRKIEQKQKAGCPKMGILKINGKNMGHRRFLPQCWMGESGWWYHFGLFPLRCFIFCYCRCQPACRATNYAFLHLLFHLADNLKRKPSTLRDGLCLYPFSQHCSRIFPAFLLSGDFFILLHHFTHGTDTPFCLFQISHFLGKHRKLGIEIKLGNIDHDHFRNLTVVISRRRLFYRDAGRVKPCPFPVMVIV